MTVILAGLLCSVTAMATALMGLMVVDSSRMRRELPTPSAPALAGFEGRSTTIAPMDFGEDKLLWPSAVARPASSTPVTQWPSEIWGTAWRSHVPAPLHARDRSVSSGEAPAPTGRSTPSPAQTAARLAARASAPARTAPAQPEDTAPQPRAAPAAGKPSISAAQLVKAPRKTAKPQRKQGQAGRKPAAPKHAGPRSAATQGPGPDEVRAIVARVGLARAVDEIRLETGWDFQKAARHLAAVLREGS